MNTYTLTCDVAQHLSVGSQYGEGVIVSMKPKSKKQDSDVDITVDHDADPTTSA